MNVSKDESFNPDFLRIPCILNDFMYATFYDTGEVYERMLIGRPNRTRRYILTTTANKCSLPRGANSSWRPRQNGYTGTQFVYIFKQLFPNCGTYFDRYLSTFILHTFLYMLTIYNK